MKFQVGDKVVVNHSNEDGIVEEIINDKMVLINVRGVKFPVHTDQVDFPYYKMFTQQKIVLPKKEHKFIDDLKREKSTARYKVTDGVWLAFLPVFDKDIFDDDVVESLKIYLINQTPTGYGFKFWLRYRGTTDLELKGEVLSLNDFYLMDIPFERLNDAPAFDFEFSLLKHEKNKVDYHEASFKPKAKQVFQKVADIRVKGDATFSFLLFLAFPPRLVEVVKMDLSKLNKAGYKVYDVKDARKHLPPPQSVIDLHIEKLHDQPDSLSGFEKLRLQLNTFEKYLELAQLHYLKEFTVIHGIGSGKLKDEIHEILRHKKGVSSFVNQYHAWYGYGATEIYLG
ncbi:MAG: Smr/MutS family protein [Chitinophagaceae bacterium]